MQITNGVHLETKKAQLQYLSLQTDRKNLRFFSDVLDEKLSFDLESIEDATDKTHLIKTLKKAPVTLIESDLCYDVFQNLQHHSSLSYRLGYSDIVVNKAKSLWGENLFSEAFYQCFMRVLKKQRFSGSVLFLGVKPISIPIIEVLSRYGFSDFVFLDTKDSTLEFHNIQNRLKTFLSGHVSKVVPSYFLKSQKNFSLCFVVDDVYDSQILEDMSYFHFLSDHSCVFDLSRRSNFLFKEVKALGVEVVELKTIEDYYLDVLVSFINNQAFNA